MSYKYERCIMSNPNVNWEDIRINYGNGYSLYCRSLVKSVKAPNIIYIQTPLGSVSGMMRRAFEPLASYEFNIFAIDLSGIGLSSGNIEEFTANRIIEDIDSCLDYIEERYLGKMFLYGGTGIGGIIGQYYASYTDRLSGFAQFGAGIYKDLEPLGTPTWLGKCVRSFLKLVTKLGLNPSCTLNPPSYNGKNKKLDDDFYTEVLKEYPDAFRTHASWLLTLLDILLDEDSYLKSYPKSPVLVFQTLSDRYFKASYFERYYNNLKTDKRIQTVDDIHNSYYYRADEFCHEVAKWFNYQLDREDIDAKV